MMDCIKGCGYLSDSPHKMGITSLLEDVRKLDVSIAIAEDDHTRSMVRVVGEGVTYS